jgi:futalosine hydrolase
MGLGDTGPFAADPVRTAEAARRLAAPIVRGATVSSARARRAGAALAGRSGAQVETMEGAAVLQVCRELGVPAVQLRCVSNRCGERSRGGWDLRGGGGSAARGCARAGAAYAWEGIE